MYMNKYNSIINSSPPEISLWKFMCGNTSLTELLVKLNQDQKHCVEKTRPNEEEQGDDNADDDNQDNEGNQKHNDYASDEHVAAVWMDEKENALSWYLGVIDSISPDNIDVIYC